MLKMIMSMKTLRVAAVVGGIAFLSLFALRSARAATTTGTFNVTATVVASCSLGTVSNLAFGNFDPTAAIGAGNGQASTTIGVTCTNGTAYTVALDYGANGGSSANRVMSDGTNTLNYNLYTDSSYKNVWYDGNTDACTATNCDSGTGTGSSQSYTVYGEIASGQNPVPSAGYTDTITITVTY